MTDALHHAHHNLAIIAATRSRMVTLLEDHNLEQLNAVPPGFNNNLIWNAAHCYVSTHRVAFVQNGVSDQEMTVMAYHPPTTDLTAAYQKGTRPTGDVDQAFVDDIIAALSHQPWMSGLAEQFLIPERYENWITSWGVELHSAGEALSYLNMHEGMHYGVMLALRKCVPQ